MKAKWYLGILTVVLILSGLREQRVSPNQEIALQFSAVDHNTTEIQNTLTDITKRLEDYGVKNIQVKEDKEQLKITYYSASDVEGVKAILSDIHAIAFNDSPLKQNKEQDHLPSDKDKILYDIDIYEILENGDSSWDFDGKLVLEAQSKADRFFYPNPYVSSLDINQNEINRQIKVAYNINRSTAIAIDHYSYKIPEVRAGPIA